MSAPQPGHPDTWWTWQGSRPWIFLGTPSLSPPVPPQGGTLSPAGGAGIHHHVDLQPLVQEVEGCVLGAERHQGNPRQEQGSGVRDLGARMGMREAGIRTVCKGC